MKKVVKPVTNEKLLDFFIFQVLLLLDLLLVVVSPGVDLDGLDVLEDFVDKVDSFVSLLVHLLVLVSIELFDKCNSVDNQE